MGLKPKAKAHRRSAQFTNMSKTPKELAFLRDLYIETDWTPRFTEIFDGAFKFADEKEILYINAGTGGHAIELRTKLEADVRLKTFSNDIEANILARAKTEVIETDIEFMDEFPRESFDMVIADGSFVPPEEFEEFFRDAVELSDGGVALFVLTAGSFGEIFSVLWESFLNAGLLDRSVELERLISSIPQVSQVEKLAKKLGLKKVKAVARNESFDFANSEEFITSPLVADFLIPGWLNFLEDGERESVLREMGSIIDENADGLSFRFTIKATVLTATKA